MQQTTSLQFHFRCQWLYISHKYRLDLLFINIIETQMYKTDYLWDKYCIFEHYSQAMGS